MKETLLGCFKTIPDALRFGDFTLRSGRKSSYYVDARKVTLNSHGLKCVVDGVLHQLWELVERDGMGAGEIADLFDTIGGMHTGADPIVGGVLHAWNDMIPRRKPLDGFLWRKEVKEHGTKQQYEGTIREGAKIVLVDDVATTGGSLIEIAEKIKPLHASIVAAMVVVDRQEGATEALAALGIPLYSLLTRDDLLLLRDQ